MATTVYPSDLTDAAWAILAPLIPVAKPGGRPRKWPRRAVLNAIFSLVRAGCAGWMLPRCFPPWSTVHQYARQWRLDGTWERIHTILQERERVRQGRAAQPTAAIIDSQSVKTTSVGGVRGYDGAKKLSGRKRHLLVDTLGLVLKATVPAADLQDRAAVPQVLDQVPAAYPPVGHIWADQGYTGSGKTWVEAELGWTVEIVRHTPHARGEWRPSATSTISRPCASRGSACRPRLSASGASSQGGGWRSERSVGWRSAGGWRRSTSACVRPARPTSTPL
jgi:putative transposase